MSFFQKMYYFFIFVCPTFCESDGSFSTKNQKYRWLFLDLKREKSIFHLSHRSWNLVTEEDWRCRQWGDCWRSVATVFLSIRAFLLAMWSLLCWNEDNEELAYFMWFALAEIFMTGGVSFWLWASLVLTTSLLLVKLQDTLLSFGWEA